MNKGDGLYINLWDKSVDEMDHPLLPPSGLLGEPADLSLFHCQSSRSVQSGLLVSGLWLEQEGVKFVLQQSQSVL